MSFQKLLSDLEQLGSEQETMSKALPADDGKDDDKAIQAAAADGGGGDGEGGEGAADDGDDDGKKKEAGEEGMAKSFEVTLPDGKKVEAVDGTELVKSLTERIETSEGQTLKALTAAMDLIRGQGEMLKSLGEQIKKLGGEGRGRKAVLSLVEKKEPEDKTLAKAEGGLTGEQFMAKALSAQSAGRLNGLEVSIAETCLNRGQAVPAQIINKVLQQ